MLHRKAIALGAALAAMALLEPRLAVAAPEDAPQEAPAVRSQPDDHSYLPPWMQPQPAGASALPPSAEAQYLSVAGDLAKQKAPLPAQKPPQKRSHTWFGVDLDVFGR